MPPIEKIAPLRRRSAVPYTASKKRPAKSLNQDTKSTEVEGLNKTGQLLERFLEQLDNDFDTVKAGAEIEQIEHFTALWGKNENLLSIFATLAPLQQRHIAFSQELTRESKGSSALAELATALTTEEIDIIRRYLQNLQEPATPTE